jgi:aryl-phospho-beta-D-glucosidase BglC (GH1 family)
MIINKNKTMSKKNMIGIMIFLSLFLLSGETARAQNTGEDGKITDLEAFCSQQKGFNLLGKYDISWSNTGFPEKEFKVISDLGFNFVRLPLDFRTYTKYADWNTFIETEVIKIDRAIEWGEKYKIHVCINLHRAPGYCVNSAPLLTIQQLDLWTDTVAQAAFVNHWKFFANRYKDVSPSRLSFNLVNEPSNVTEEAYLQVMKKAIDTIHAITPHRVIFVDGLDYARKIILSLKDQPNIAQSIHSYDPFQLTHYKASWVKGSSDWPVPHWPMLWVSSYLYGPWKSDFKSSLVLQGNFHIGTKITVNVRQVSTESTLRIKAGSKIIYSKRFVCGAEPGEDFTRVVQTEWGYQNISNKDFSIVMNESAASLTFENASGDWMTINSISLQYEDKTFTYNLSDNSWGKKQSTYLIDEEGVLKTQDGKELLPFNDYIENFELARANKIPVMVQEFGVHNKTPHATSVAFLTDLSRFFRDQNMGWALWNLTGSFGILNSGRTDCKYEAWQGYSLDRAMLEALAPTEATWSRIRARSQNLKIYPVPATKELFVSFENPTRDAKAEIRDMTGRILQSYSIPSSAAGIHRFDISMLKPGVYIIVTFDEGKVTSGKFIIGS